MAPTNAELNQTIQALQAQVDALQAAAAAAAAAEPQPLPPIQQAVVQEPKIGEPPEFTGKPTEYTTFINHCDLFFRLRPATFADAFTKVAYVISRCRGNAAEWGNSLIESDSPLLRDYNEFKKQMTSIYSDKQRQRTFRRRLTSLKQTGSASKYAAEFNTIVNVLNIDEESRIALFTNGLKPDVQRALAFVRDIDTFDDLVDAAVQIDHTNFTLNKELKTSTTNSSTKPSSSTHFNRHLTNTTSTSTSTSSRSPFVQTQSKSVPNKSTPRGPLSTEEKSRRIHEGLCLYCGKSGHLRKDCPELLAKPERSTTSTAAVTTTSIFTPNLSAQAPPIRSGKPESQNLLRQGF